MCNMGEITFTQVMVIKLSLNISIVYIELLMPPYWSRFWKDKGIITNQQLFKPYAGPSQKLSSLGTQRFRVKQQNGVEGWLLVFFVLQNAEAARFVKPVWGTGSWIVWLPSGGSCTCCAWSHCYTVENKSRR